jgi:hypothetical protein
MIIYKNLYAQRIYDIIFPVLGELMAKGSLRTQCNNLGISEETIQQKDLPAIAEKLRKGLILFLGTDGSMQIASKIMKL